MLRQFSVRFLSANRAGVIEGLRGSTVHWCQEADCLSPVCGDRGHWLHAQAQPANNEDEEVREIGSPRVRELAEEILRLNLLEIADLTTILKEKLNLSETPMFGAMPAQQQQAAQPAGPAAQAPVEEKKEEEEEKKVFDLKLDGFDATAKIKVIKEIRAITELGLKQAKELVEKAPQLVKAGVDKKTGEELKKKLEAAGAKVSLE